MPNIKIKWHEIEKLPNGARYRRFVDGKPTNSYKLELEGGDPTLDLSVGAQSDDAFEYLAGLVNIDALYYNIDSYGEHAGFRWTGVNIPSGAIIGTAYVSVYVDTEDDPRIWIYCQDANNPPTFVAENNNITSRSKTTEKATWNADNIGTGAFKNSPSLTDVIQEVVDDNGGIGDALIAIFECFEDYNFIFFTYDFSDHSYAPKIHIEYTEGGAALEKNLIDAVAIADSIVKTTGLNKADTVTIADSISKLMRLIKADIATIADSISKAVGLIKADTITIADAIAKAVSLVKTDTVIIVDTFTKIVSYIRSLVDSVGITDSISKTVSIVKADTVAITETMAAVRGKVINLFDTVTIADTMTTVLSAGAIILKQSIARMQIKGLDIARMSFKKMGIAKMPLYRWITRRWTA